MALAIPTTDHQSAAHRSHAGNDEMDCLPVRHYKQQPIVATKLNAEPKNKNIMNMKLFWSSRSEVVNGANDDATEGLA
jgi:hypothetical protein